MQTKGFNALNQIETYKEIDFSLFEKQIGVVLPSEYKFIVQNFAMGEASFNTEKYLHDKHEILLPSISYFYENYLTGEGVDIHEFASYEATLGAGVYEYCDTKMLLIGLGTTATNTYIGVSKDYFGKILRASNSSWDDQSDLVVLANDLFEFIRGLFAVKISSFNNIPFERLYKNWGEDFWRIRPNETAPPNPLLDGNADHRKGSP